MPITIEYQPSLVAGGQIAYQAGRGRFLQEQDRFNFQQAGLAEQQRQFDQRLQFSAQEAALRDQQLRQQLGQRAELTQQQLAYRDMADRRGIAANFQMQEMQQAGWDQRNKMQLQLAQMQDAAAQARLKQTQQFTNAMQEKDTLQKYITENAAVLSPEQAQGLVAQWEGQHKLPWGFDAAAVIEAQQAQEAKMAAELEEVAGMLGMPPNSIGKLIDWIPDKNGKPIISPTPLGEAWLKQQEQEEQREADRERIAEMEATKRAQNAAKQEEELVKQQTETAKLATQAASNSLSALGKLASDHSAVAAANEVGETKRMPSIWSYNWPVLFNMDQVGQMPVDTPFMWRNVKEDGSSEQILVIRGRDGGIYRLPPAKAIELAEALNER